MEQRERVVPDRVELNASRPPTPHFQPVQTPPTRYLATQRTVRIIARAHLSVDRSAPAQKHPPALERAVNRIRPHRNTRPCPLHALQQLQTRELPPPTPKQASHFPHQARKDRPRTQALAAVAQEQPTQRLQRVRPVHPPHRFNRLNLPSQI